MATTAPPEAESYEEIRMIINIRKEVVNLQLANPKFKERRGRGNQIQVPKTSGEDVKNEDKTFEMVFDSPEYSKICREMILISI